MDDEEKEQTFRQFLNERMREAKAVPQLNPNNRQFQYLIDTIFQEIRSLCQVAASSGKEGVCIKLGDLVEKHINASCSLQGIISRVDMQEFSSFLQTYLKERTDLKLDKMWVHPEPHTYFISWN